MAKITSGELHGNDNASILFDGVVRLAIDTVRYRIEALGKSRKADEYAPGAIHALRKLCDNEEFLDCPVNRGEVQEWKACFDSWFNRVKRHFPDALATEFQANANDDFEVLFLCARDMPEFMWRDQSRRRHVQVRFKTGEDLDAAIEAADQKHPVELGSALETYLDRCIADLLDEPADVPSVPAVEPQTEPCFSPTLAARDDGRFSLVVDEFDVFDSQDDLEQDIVVNAYDLEGALRRYLTDHSPASMAELEFGSESSMFCVDSKSVDALAKAMDGLMRLATDHDVFVSYSRSD